MRSARPLPAARTRALPKFGPPSRGPSGAVWNVGRVPLDSAFGRRSGDDVVEPDRPCRAAELDEAEVPGRRRHRAPLLALSADVEGPVPPAGGRRAAPACPAPDLSAGQVRNARDDEGTDFVPDGQLVEKNDAGPLAGGERPGCPAWAEPERPCRLDQGSELARLVSAGRGGERGVRWAAVWCSLMAVSWPAAAGGSATAKATAAATMPHEWRAQATRAAVRRAQIPLVCIGRSDEPAECSITRVARNLAAGTRRALLNGAARMPHTSNGPTGSGHRVWRAGMGRAEPVRTCNSAWPVPGRTPRSRARGARVSGRPERRRP